MTPDAAAQIALALNRAQQGLNDSHGSLNASIVEALQSMLEHNQVQAATIDGLTQQVGSLELRLAALELRLFAVDEQPPSTGAQPHPVTAGPQPSTRVIHDGPPQELQLPMRKLGGAPFGIAGTDE